MNWREVGCGLLIWAVTESRSAQFGAGSRRTSAVAGTEQVQVLGCVARKAERGVGKNVEDDGELDVKVPEVDDEVGSEQRPRSADGGDMLLPTTTDASAQKGWARWGGAARLETPRASTPSSRRRGGRTGAEKEIKRRGRG
jgi:hypothetical protein